MIVILIGGSATGKTTIAEMMLRELGGSRMLVSWTTRPPRPSDVAGEYAHLSLDDFARKRDAGEFEWHAEFDGSHYGTAKADIVEALREADCRIMILLPYAVEKLFAVARMQGLEGSVQAFHLLPPAPEVLEARMRTRGDSPASIERRLAAGVRLEEDVRRLAGMPILAVADSSAERKFRTILNAIER